MAPDAQDASARRPWGFPAEIVTAIGAFIGAALGKEPAESPPPGEESRGLFR